MGVSLSDKPACCCSSAERVEIVQIDVFGETIGLIGLYQTFEQLRLLERPPDATVEDELVLMVGARNYIPAKCEDEYRVALLREYARYCRQKAKAGK